MKMVTLTIEQISILQGILDRRYEELHTCGSGDLEEEEEEEAIEQITLALNSAVNKEQITEIAKKHLGIQTLECRKSDSLDFHEVSVWSVQAALEAAFAAGQNAAKGGKR